MKNLVNLFVIRGIQILFPLITIPFLARKLDKADFALVLLIQATGVLFSLVVEYGFNYSATRSIASTLEESEQQRSIFSQVTYSKLILSIFCLLSVILYNFLFVNIGLRYVIVTFILSVSQGFLPIWYFQGNSRLNLPVISEIVSKLLIVIFMLLLVKQSNNGGIYLVIVAIFNFLSALWQNAYIYARLGLDKMSLSSTVIALRDGFNIFVFRLGSALYTGGSLVLLGSVVSPAVFASYAGADRVFRASAALTAPVGDAFFPRIVNALAYDAQQVASVRKRASFILLLFSLFLFCVVFFGAPIIVNILLGTRYGDTIHLLRILAFDIPLIAVGTVVGVFWLLAEKLDKYVTLSVVLAGLWSVFAIFVLVPRFGISWMAISIIIAEIIVILTGLVGIRRHREKR